MYRIAADYPVGGKPTYGLQPNFYYLSHEQAKLGNTVRVIARRHGQQPSLEHDEEVEIHRVDNPFNISAYRMLRDLASKDPQGSSLIHTHSTSGLSFGGVKRTLGLPLFAHVHGASRSSRMPQRLKGVVDEEFSQTKMWYYYFRERLFWSSADMVLSVSDALRRDLITYYGIQEKRVRTVYNGVDTQLFYRRKGENPGVLKRFQGKRIILYVGHFGPRKGLIFLIRAMKHISKEIPDAVAVGIGGVPSWLGKQQYWNVLNDEIKKNDVGDKMLLLDRVPNEQLPAYYSSADVFVLPSFYEAFAKVVLEAMACEDPIVITREGGPREAIQEGKTGLLVNYGSAEEIAHAVIAVLQDERRAREMGALARKRVEQQFTWGAVAERINSAYDEVVKGSVMERTG